MALWVKDTTACIKIVGRANVTCSVDFKRLIERLRELGCENISLELTECLLMDSTFLGTLARFACEGSLPKEGASPLRFRLINANERVTEMLDNLCVIQLFTLASCAGEPAPALEPVPNDPGVSREEVTRTALEAHLALTSIAPCNQPKFKDVLQFFAEQLKRMEAQGDSGPQAS